MRSWPLVTAILLASSTLAGCGQPEVDCGGEAPFLAKVTRTGMRGPPHHNGLEQLESLGRDGSLFVYAGIAGPGSGRITFAPNGTIRLDEAGVREGLEALGRYHASEDYEVHVAWRAAALAKELQAFCLVLLEEWVAPAPDGPEQVSCLDGGRATYELSTQHGTVTKTWLCDGSPQPKAVWDSIDRIDTAFGTLRQASAPT